MTLQRKIAAYRQLQHDTTASSTAWPRPCWSRTSATLDATLRQLNQFGYDFDRLQFVAKDEVELLAEVQERLRPVHPGRDPGRRADPRRARSPRAGAQAAQAGPLADRLERLTNQLVNRAEADMVASIEASQGRYLTSLAGDHGFAVGSIALALVLGYAISWSLIGPVEQMDASFNEIAVGRFLQADRRPEPRRAGSLATNLNRMNDELGRLYRQLEAANLAKSRFLAAASHDLRQPLHALNLFVAQLRTETDHVERGRIAAQIDASVTAMNDLFNALLDISKLDAGALAPNLRDFPIADLLRHIETTFAPRLGRRGCACDSRAATPGSRAISSCSSGSCSTSCPTRSGTPSGGASSSAAGAAAGDCASRSGTAASAFRRINGENVFGEFYRLCGPDSERRGGLGLGLAIVERLCRLLDHRDRAALGARQRVVSCSRGAVGRGSSRTGGTQPCARSERAIRPGAS